MATEYLVAIMVRSAIDANPKISGILNRMGLRKRLTLVVHKSSEEIKNQFKEIKDYITYGEIDEGYLTKLLEKRGQESETGKLVVKGKKYKRHMGMHPPVKGFERGGIKKGFGQGGALGYRGQEISKLIERML
jgi:large subunit ribosomal protein L30